MFRYLLATLVAQLLLLTATHAAELDAADVLKSFEAATNAVSSYDVVVECESVAAARAVQTGTRLQGTRMVPVIKWEPLPPGAEPTISAYRSRQVFFSDGRRRFERLAGSDEGVVKVFNGETTKEYSAKNNFGLIRSRGPEQNPFPLPFENYSSLFHRVFLGGELVNLFRERAEIVAKRSEVWPGKIVLEADSQEGASMYPAFAFRLVLDPERGMLPVRIEAFRGTFESRAYSFETTKFHQLQSGAWVPVEARIVEGPESLVKYVTTLRVDMDESTWNVPPDETEFELSFPPGTRVIED